MRARRFSGDRGGMTWDAESELSFLAAEANHLQERLDLIQEEMGLIRDRMTELKSSPAADEPAS